MIFLLFFLLSLSIFIMVETYLHIISLMIDDPDFELSMRKAIYPIGIVIIDFLKAIWNIQAVDKIKDYKYLTCK